MKSSLNWKPNINSSPCYVKGEECENKHKFHGTCRNSCETYAHYTELKSKDDAIKHRKNHNRMLLDEYECRGIEKLRRRIW